MNTDDTRIGMNRTGIATAPIQAPRAIEASHELVPDALAGGDGAMLVEDELPEPPQTPNIKGKKK